jgi:DNA-binding response OmpR family regulator
MMNHGEISENVQNGINYRDSHQDLNKKVSLKERQNPPVHQEISLHQPQEKPQLQPVTKESLKPRILVVEDETDIAELVEYNLKKHGYEVTLAHSGEQALALLMDAKKSFDGVVLDLMMPPPDGLTVLKHLRQSHGLNAAVAVMLLTAKGEESDIVIGLELGADDYLTKPFSPRELVARMRALLRRTDQKSGADSEVASKSQADGGLGPRSESGKTVVGPVTIDAERHEIFLFQQPMVLTLAEFKLVQALTSRPGRVFTRDQLLEKISGGDTYVIDRNIDVHVRSIRKKFGDHADFIQTVRGVGYKCREK